MNPDLAKLLESLDFLFFYAWDHDDHSHGAKLNLTLGSGGGAVRPTNRSPLRGMNRLLPKGA